MTLQPRVGMNSSHPLDILNIAAAFTPVIILRGEGEDRKP